MQYVCLCVMYLYGYLRSICICIIYVRCFMFLLFLFLLLFIIIKIKLIHSLMYSHHTLNISCRCGSPTGRVAPRLVVRGEDAEVTASHKVLIVHRQQWRGGRKELWVEDDLKETNAQHQRWLCSSEAIRHGHAVAMAESWHQRRCDSCPAPDVEKPK